MRLFTAFLAGAIFSIGLLISGMTDTQKVIGFLDIFGQWDLTLMFVMAGALLPMFIAWKIAARKDVSLLGDTIEVKPNPTIDKRLISGAILFGIGWGLVGFCPGPALVSLAYGGLNTFIFVVSMLSAMLLHDVFFGPRRC